MKRFLLSLCILISSLSVSYAQNDSLPDINGFTFAEQEPEPTNMDEIRKLIGYPPEAVEQDLQGQVVVRVLVDEKGQYMKHKTIVKGHPLLAAAVEAQVDKLTFSPAIQEGKAIKFWVNIPFSFKLVGPEDEYKMAVEKELKRLDAEIEKDPQNYDPYTNRGLQFSGLGEYEKAIADFDKSISLNPGKNKKKKNLDYPYLFYAYLGKGKTYLSQKQWNEDSSFRATIPTAYAERGSAMMQLELFEAARRDFDKALYGADSANTCAIFTLK
jgi:TonB family protein